MLLLLLLLLVLMLLSLLTLVPMLMLMPMLTMRYDEVPFPNGKKKLSQSRPKSHVDYNTLFLTPASRIKKKKTIHLGYEVTLTELGTRRNGALYRR